MAKENLVNKDYLQVLLKDMDIPDQEISIQNHRNLMNLNNIGCYFNFAGKYVSAKNIKSLFVINFTDKA